MNKDQEQSAMKALQSVARLRALSVENILLAPLADRNKGDVDMPVVGKINVSDEDDCRFYRSDDDQTPAGSFLLAKQIYAQAALAAKDAELVSDESKAAVVRLHLHNAEIRIKSLQAMYKSIQAEIATMPETLAKSLFDGLASHPKSERFSAFNWFTAGVASNAEWQKIYIDAVTIKDAKK